MQNKLISFLWGDLSKDEIKKFSLLSFGFFLIIGSYWPLKALKDSIFVNIVGANHLPEVKILSLLFYFPLILLYSKIVDYFSKEKILYNFILLIGVFGLFIVYFLNHPTIGLANTSCGVHRIIGWVFYVFVEGYINLLVSLYWAFINDVTTPESAKKGYGMIAFGTQLGGVLFTLLGNYLSKDASLYATRAPLIALISVVTFFFLAFIVWSLKYFVPSKELSGYKVHIEKEKEEGYKKINVGFFDGLKIILSRSYVASIFAIIFIYEVITTIMSFQMYSMAKTSFLDPGQLNKFVFDYALAVQSIACIVALFGTSFFQRKLGIKFCLVSYPILLGLSIIIYFFNPSLNIIFYAMVLSKALNFSFNQPAKESLYIPTSKEIKYKSKAWIDIFGARAAKSFGSGIYKIAGTLVGFSSVIILTMIGIWIILSDKVGNKFSKTISNNELIQ